MIGKYECSTCDMWLGFLFVSGGIFKLVEQLLFMLVGNPHVVDIEYFWGY